MNVVGGRQTSKHNSKIYNCLQKRGFEAFFNTLGYFLNNGTSRICKIASCFYSHIFPPRLICDFQCFGKPDFMCLIKDFGKLLSKLNFLLLKV